LLHFAPNVLLIPGTSSLEHLEENLAAGSLELDSDAMAELDRVTQDSNSLEAR
jgi:pyridoxine 4-dehydrogenase